MGMGGKRTEGGPGPVVLDGQVLESSTPATSGPGERVFAQRRDTGIDACVNHEERAVLDGLAALRAPRGGASC